MRSLAPIYLVNLLFPIWGEWNAPIGVQFIQNALAALAFRLFGRNVIQFVLVYLERQLQYTVQFMSPFPRP